MISPVFISPEESELPSCFLLRCFEAQAKPTPAILQAGFPGFTRGYTSRIHEHVIDGAARFLHKERHGSRQRDSRGRSNYRGHAVVQVYGQIGSIEYDFCMIESIRKQINRIYEFLLHDLLTVYLLLQHPRVLG